MAEHYSISEMAKFFGVSRQTLIYYDKIGLFRPALVNDEGYRLYSPTQIPELRLTCLLKDLGLELKEIREILDSRDLPVLIDNLQSRRCKVNADIERLQMQRSLIERRIDFYQEARIWGDRVDAPIIQQYGDRSIVVSQFPQEAPIDRSVLHPTLMTSMQKLRTSKDGVPVSGFGTVLERGVDGKSYLPWGTFVVVPQGMSREGLQDARVLPEGLYACMSYWGMPYQPYGSERLAAWLREHEIRAVGPLYDLCMLDATSYNERHQQDLCCIQVRVEFS